MQGVSLVMKASSFMLMIVIGHKARFVPMTSLQSDLPFGQIDENMTLSIVMIDTSCFVFFVAGKYGELGLFTIDLKRR